MSLANHRESQEMYLKAIYTLRKENPGTRAIDVGEELGYAKSSVSRALKLLEQDGFIIRTEDNIVRFTEKGLEKAKYLDERYTVLVELFLKMGLTKEEAERTACEIEHVIDLEVYKKMKNYLETISK